MEKFKSFVFGLLTNRLGIFLATINVCYFVSVLFSKPAYLMNGLEKIMLVQNFPALILAMAFSKIIEFLFFDAHQFISLGFIYLICTFFITFQWLFVGWLTKTLARVIRKNYLSQN